MMSSRTRVLTIGTILLGSVVVVAPAVSTPPSTSESHYRIDSEHVRAGPIRLGSLEGLAKATMIVSHRPDGSYGVRGGLRGTYFAYHSQLSFHAEGRMVDGRHESRRWEAKIVHDSIFADDETRTTTIEFDRARGVAHARGLQIQDGAEHVLYDVSGTALPIDARVQDPVSAILDAVAAGEARDHEVRTIVSGRPTTYRLRALPAEAVTVAGAAVPCRVWSLAVPAGVIDDFPYRFTVWTAARRGNVLQARIAPGGNHLLARFVRTVWR
jgi:hypothetical protein